jgi:hypothetical protein
MAVCLAGPTGRLTLLAVTAQSGAGRYATAAISPGHVTQVLNRAKRLAEAEQSGRTTRKRHAGVRCALALGSNAVGRHRRGQCRIRARAELRAAGLCGISSGARRSECETCRCPDLHP